ERFLFLSGCKFDFAKTLISFYVSRIQSDSAVSIIDSLIRLLEILRINERQLTIWFGLVRICFDCVFQHVDRLWIIFLLYQQSCYSRGELGLAWIDIEHFAVRLQCLIHLAGLLESDSFHKMCKRSGFAFALRTQHQVRRRLQIE